MQNFAGKNISSKMQQKGLIYNNIYGHLIISEKNQNNYQTFIFH